MYRTVETTTTRRKIKMELYTKYNNRADKFYGGYFSYTYTVARNFHEILARKIHVELCT